MSDDSYVFEGPAEAAAPRDNNPPLSISELSFALKRTLEERFGHVRLRGEVSKVNRHASGHVYLTLKDDKSAIDGVIWKGSVRGLGVQPEAGLEVIVTGKITSYPARSSYQIVIETMEAAGAGALLAQLERLKLRLREEGLFEPGRKKPLPQFPRAIGVITSPTGAVIRDVLHRIAERWPCRVIVWPVVVQGEAACGQVSNAIRGFDAMTPDGPIPRPDLLIVARGGGSVEDLWCFNDEGLARTVAAARIPIISAVGHETDTTLIDFVSDRRAPTPTGAAEMATPVLADLRYAVADLDRRLVLAGGRLIEVSGLGTNSLYPVYKDGDNQHKNPFGSEVAMFKTSEGGMSRMAVSWDMKNAHGEQGRVYGQKPHDKKIKGSRPPLPPGVSGGGHGGSHGQLTNNFIESILLDKKPIVDVGDALNMTLAGVIAHQSALKGGEWMKIPQYDL